jgi:hypothetical protein
MRLLFLGLLLSFTSLFIGCSSDSNSSNSNGNSFTNSIDYEFTLTINGEVHKVKGNTSNGIPKGTTQSSINYINNECEIQSIPGQTQKVLELRINDVTASNYISGQNLECRITFPNLLMGINQAKIMFDGSYFDSICASLGAYTLGSGLGFRDFQTASGSFNASINSVLPINITDLGTTSTNPFGWSPSTPFSFGETLKGSYSGTIYLKSSTNTINYSIPVQVSIDFKAIRLY